jgi:hypothetical protein
VLAEAPPLARVRVQPAPDPDPAFVPADPVTTGSAEQTLPLLFVLPTGVSSAPPACVDPVFDRQPTRTSDLPDADAWVARLSRAAVEVQVGARPVTQLRRWLSDEVYDELRSAVPRPTARVAEPVRRTASRPPRVVLRTVRTCEVGDGAVEGCAVVDDGRRAWALVLRLEGADGRWRCTTLQRVADADGAA